MLQWQQATSALTAALQVQKKAQQTQWLSDHHPELGEAVEFWSVRLKGTTNDRDRAHAKKEHGAALMAYEQARVLAPTEG